MPKIRTIPAALALLGLAAAAPATTLVYLSLEDLNGLSDEVVIGRVERVEPYLERDGQTIFTAVTLEVMESVKGEAEAGERITLHHLGGEVNGIALRYASMPAFHQGADVAVFLERLGRDAFGLVGLGQGVLDVENRDGAWRAVRRLSGIRFLNPQFPGRGSVHESRADESFTLGELRSLVREGGQRRGLRR